MGVILWQHLCSHHQHEARDAGLVIISAFHWTKGKEDAAFALACLDFLPPHTLALALECIIAVGLRYPLHYFSPHSISQQCSQVSHFPFIHRILAEDNTVGP